MTKEDYQRLHDLEEKFLDRTQQLSSEELCEYLCLTDMARADEETLQDK